MEVELDVFSGRANPSWSLSADEEEELGRRLSALAPTGSLPAAADLGYRGFRIVDDLGEVRVFAGAVTVTDATGSRVLADTVGVERWLADQARSRGYGPLVETVR